jgi:hypothetical protein
MLLRGSSFGGLASSRKSPRSIIYKARRSEGDAEALASKLEPELAKAILDAFVKQQGNADVDAIITALEAGDVGKVLELLDLPASIAAFEGVTSSLHTGANAAGAMAAAQVALQVKGVSFAFNSLNPRLITWLQTYSLRLIRQISDGTREGIRQYLTQGMKDGKNPKAVARQIKGIIGLTDKQAQAVYNYRKELETFHLKRSAGSWGLGNKIDQVNGTQVLRPGEDGGPLDGIGQRRLRDFRYDGQLKRALESGKPLKPEQIDKMVAAYQRKYLAYRSRTIARTEAIRTTNMGIQDAWQQALDKGVVKEDLTRKKWIVSADERLCQVCGPIPGLNPPKGIKHQQSFITPDGPQMLPPMHPNCRCTVFYRVYEPQQLKETNNG